MILYEATNGYEGESYVRCYVWAGTEELALRLATEKFNASAPHSHRPGTPIELRELMYVPTDDVPEPFCTNVSDNGWKT